MNSNLARSITSNPNPLKRASRPGRFKSCEVNLVELQGQVPKVLNALRPFIELWRQRHIGDASMACAYILAFLSIRAPRLCLQGPRTKRFLSKASNIDLTLAQLPLWDELKASALCRNIDFNETTLLELIDGYNIKSLPEPAVRALMGWSEQKYHLKLCTHIPSSIEVLEQQISGSRCVSMILEPEHMMGAIKTGRDVCSFLIHDLLHADHFYQNREIMFGQIGFYKWIHRAFVSGFFSKSIEIDSLFEAELEYGFSDMNAYIVHLIKYLKAICLRHFLRIEKKAMHEQLSPKGRILFEEYWKNLVSYCDNLALNKNKDALLKINTPQFDEALEGTLLAQAFESVGKFNELDPKTSS